MRRAGSTALSVFTRAHSADVLRAHGDGAALSFRELERRLGAPPPSSLRMALGGLGELGALAHVGQRPTRTALSASGRELLGLGDALERWLARAPAELRASTGASARGVIRGLAAGWELGILHRIAGRPRGLSALNREVTEHSYATLKRSLAALRAAALAIPAGEGERSPDYEPTPLLRRGARPIALAARWERSHLVRSAAFSGEDMEALFLLALPIVGLPAGATGSCVLAMPRSSENVGGSPAAVSVVVDRGRIVAIEASSARPDSATWALGTVDGWLDVLIAGRLDRLRVHGSDGDFVTALLAALAQAVD